MRLNKTDEAKRCIIKVRKSNKKTNYKKFKILKENITKEIKKV